MAASFCTFIRLTDHELSFHSSMLTAATPSDQDARETFAQGYKVPTP